jgi:chromosome segregation ATPase
MDASSAKAVAAGLALVQELDESLFGPFYAEAQQLVAQLQTSQVNYAALTDKQKALSQELDAARRALHEVRQEEEDLSNAMKQIHEDSARLQEENQKAKLATAFTENAIRDAKARIVSLESQRDAGSGWTSDQLAMQQDRRDQKSAVMSELEVRRSALVKMRVEVGALSAQVEAAHSEKAATDVSITELKDAVAACKTQAVTLGRSRDLLDRELREMQARRVQRLSLAFVNPHSQPSDAMRCRRRLQRYGRP